MAKYELTEFTKVMEGHVLHRIKYCTKGVDHYGGWLESEYNLDQEGKCAVEDEACVYGNARVTGDAVVEDRAIVRDSAVIKDAAKITGSGVVSGNVNITERSVVYGTIEAQPCAGTSFVRDSIISVSAYLSGSFAISDTVVEGDVRFTGQGGLRKAPHSVYAYSW